MYLKEVMFSVWFISVFVWSVCRITVHNFEQIVLFFFFLPQVLIGCSFKGFIFWTSRNLKKSYLLTLGEISNNCISARTLASNLNHIGIVSIFNPQISLTLKDQRSQQVILQKNLYI